MINNPEIMILDEPFRGLDAMTKQLMWEYYLKLFEENRRTNLFVTTDIDEASFLRIEYSSCPMCRLGSAPRLKSTCRARASCWIWSK